MRGVRSIVVGLLIGLFSVAPVSADQFIKTKYSTLVVPTGSPVRYTGQDDPLTARFDGTFVLTGTYHVTYTKTQGSGYSDVWFEPDASLVAKLPYWQHYKQHATQITFNNTDEFVKSVLSENVLSGLQHKRPTSISGRLGIKVTAYQTGIECDWPWFAVHFLSIERAPVVLADAKTDYIGC